MAKYTIKFTTSTIPDVVVEASDFHLKDGMVIFTEQGGTHSAYGVPQSSVSSIARDSAVQAAK